MHNLNHIAFIPDGNRRWARSKGLPTLEGHRRGFNTLEKVAKRVRELGIHTFTVWAFSTENWNREKSEVDYLMRVYREWLSSIIKTAVKDRVRMQHIGRTDRIPKGLQHKITEAEEKTKEFTEHMLGFAIDYGGRDEIVRAAARIQKSGKQITSADQFGAFLDTASFKYPDPDFVIRTGGENRTSGFMTWQAAYAEWIFSEKFLPDFTVADFNTCIGEYHHRQRRFGK